MQQVPSLVKEESVLSPAHELPQHLTHFQDMPVDHLRTRLAHYQAQCRHHGLHEAADTLGSLLDFLVPIWPVVGLTVGVLVGFLLTGGIGPAAALARFAGGFIGVEVGEKSGVLMAKAAEALHLYSITTGDHEAQDHANLLAHVAKQQASSSGV